MKSGFKNFIHGWLISTLAVLVAVFIVPGIHFQDGQIWMPFMVAFVLGILNAFIRPIMMLLSLPLLIYTLGLFTIVINAALLYFVGVLLPWFKVETFGAALLGAVVIGFVSLVLNIFAGFRPARVTFRKNPRRPDPDGDGGGPVIDV